jgi:hypothetical protein
VNSSVRQTPVALISTSTSPSRRSVELHGCQLQRSACGDSNGGANIHVVILAFEFRYVIAREPARADWRCRAAYDRALRSANES